MDNLGKALPSVSVSVYAGEMLKWYRVLERRGKMGIHVYTEITHLCGSISIFVKYSVLNTDK